MGTIFDRLTWTLFLLACVLLAFITLSVSLNVAMRYFLERPLRGVTEVISYALVFITFLSAAWVLRTDKHVKMDIVVNRLNPRTRAVLYIIIYILSAMAWLVVAWYSGQITWQLFLRGERINSLLEPFKAPLVAIVPLGSFLLFVESLRRAHAFWKSLKA